MCSTWPVGWILLKEQTSILRYSRSSNGSSGIGYGGGGCGGSSTKLISRTQFYSKRSCSEPNLTAFVVKVTP